MLKRKSIVPEYRPLITIDYKYKYQKVLYFITTEDIGITKVGTPYLSN